ncbi:MAG: FtsQ-type POTRA domain-containing protein [Ruminococcus sp.]|nr:FtsQ-type POTRA domain-containing protein [Ruminococcus sp.]
MATVKKVKRRLNVKGCILLLLFIYLIVMLFREFISMPIKNIYIYNTNLLTDNEIIEVAGIKDYPSIIKTSTKALEKKISSLELVKNVEVKKDYFGKIVINIEEERPLFYNRNTNKIVLSSKVEVESSNYLGIPTLINYVPKDLLNDFILSWDKIDDDIIKMINEIEYKPDIKDDVTIDDKRFLLRMNDDNTVYVNVLNMKRLNDYKKVIMAIGEKRGTLYLDSYNNSNDLVGLFDEYKAGDNNEPKED